MDYDQWEEYYNRLWDVSFMTINELSEETGCDVDTINELVYDGFFGELYEAGFFDEHSIEFLKDYMER